MLWSALVVVAAVASTTEAFSMPGASTTTRVRLPHGVCSLHAQAVCSPALSRRGAVGRLRRFRTWLATSKRRKGQEGRWRHRTVWYKNILDCRLRTDPGSRRTFDRGESALFM